MTSSPSPRPGRRVESALRAFLSHGAAGGLVLMAAAFAALIVANSPLADAYQGVLHASVGGLSVSHWINDGLMALFFLLVGLEMKRELIDGQLAAWPRRILPGVAAAGGMIVPALVYLAFNLGSGGRPAGWAIPAATDIAFALGVLALLGDRVPASLRVFLTALAIIDDLGAIVIIALFYSGDLNILALLASAGVLVLLVALNRLKVRALTPYLLLGAVLWVLVLKSGIHATLAGVALAFTIPIGDRPEVEHGAAHGGEHGPLLRLEHALQPWVNFLVVPVFGFANAGVSLFGLTAADLMQPVPLGVALGLFLGKQLGVYAAAMLVVRSGWADLPAYATPRQLYGVALLCGIGFTMSLFIGLLAFPGDPALQDAVKLGVLAGSLASALVGAALLVMPSAAAVRRRP
jgi:NhaA family Na+:H+ antiporter